MLSGKVTESGFFFRKWKSDKMKKTVTLKKNYEFKKVLTRGKYYSGNFIEVFITRNKQKCNYIGIAISVKLAKAVKRNRIKRLIRENYRLMEDKLKTGFNIVFLWKKKADISNATFINIKRDMEKIFFKAGVINNEENLSVDDKII